MLSSWFGQSSSTPTEAKPLIFPECETPKTPDEFRSLAEKKVKQLLDLESDEGWHRLSFNEAGHEDIELFDRQSQEFPNCDIVKARARMRVPLKRLWDMINCRDVETIKKWQPDLLSERRVEDPTDDIHVDYMTVSTPFPVTNRCFVLMRHNRILEDGTHVHVGCSINHEDFPEDKQFVRGQNIVSGFILRPIEGRDDEFILTRIIQLDSKGSLPAWLVKMFKHKTAVAIVNMRKYLAQNDS